MFVTLVDFVFRSSQRHNIGFASRLWEVDLYLNRNTITYMSVNEFEHPASTYPRVLLTNIPDGFTFRTDQRAMEAILDDNIA